MSISCSYANHKAATLACRYKTKNKTVPVLGEINDLYRYYSNFVKNINLVEDENLKETTLSLVQNLNTEQEKIKAIFENCEERENPFAGCCSDYAWPGI